MAFNTNKVINGTWGKVWINDDWMANATALEAKVTIEKEEIKQTGTLSKGYKVTGIDGKGTVKLNKVNSYFIKLMSENIKNGQSTICTITSTLADPASDGQQESITLYGCIFDEMTLIDWESKKMGEESIPFTFTDWDVTDTID